MEFNRKEYNAKYYQEHKEQFREYRKKYYQEHKKEIIEKQKQWYQEHKKENQEYTKRWINKSEENKKRYLQSLYKSRRNRVERLREQGCKNAWEIVLRGAEPKY